MKKWIVCCLLLGCTHTTQSQAPCLTSVQIIDRNGFNETINTPDRLSLIEKNDLTQPQPYTKVVRTFSKTAQGKSPSCITTYHPNGHLWQYLEGIDGRANGAYREYFPNGQLRLEAHVIEGECELHPDIQEGWIFDGVNKAWDQSGHLIAEITYHKGSLEGQSLYYFPSGALKKSIPYTHDVIHGTVNEYDEYGSLILAETFEHGKKHGIVKYNGTPSIPPYRETYHKGKLMQAVYFDLDGNVLSEIRNGDGEKSLFDQGVLEKKIEYHAGQAAGKIKTYHPEGYLLSEYTLLHDQKYGEEWIYYANGEPKMLIQWYGDEIHGTVKTWYQSGAMESQREMSHNKRQGHSFAWYENGDLMHMEEYENNLLMKGSYMKKGLKDPVSSVKNGSGTATLHDASGLQIKKIEYRHGHPSE